MYDSSRVFGLKALVALLLVAVLPGKGLAADWSLADFKAAKGQVEQTPEGLLLTPDASGKIYLTVAVPELDLSRFQIVHLKTQSRVPVSHFLVWRTREQGDKAFQFMVPAPVLSAGDGVFEMSGRPQWQGRATMLGLGLLVPGGKPVLLSEFQLHQPGLAYDLGRHLEQWAGYQPWQLSDVNFYTGTRGYGQGVSLALVLASLLLLFLSVYLICLLLLRRMDSFSWRVVAGAVFVAWLAIDMIWQYRLVERAMVTRDTYSQKEGEERLLASPDASVVQLVRDIRPYIEGQHPRIFIASRSEYHAVLGSYYLTPWNTYTRKKGEELPFKGYIKPGDYVLVVYPSLTRIDSKRGILHVRRGQTLPIETLYAGAAGRLVRVVQ